MAIAGCIALLLYGFTAFQSAQSCPTCDANFARLTKQGMERMDRDMRGAPMTGNPDLDFAAMMIPHHQGAIDMAQAELLYGKDPVLRRMAQEIIVTQQAEIEVLQARTKALARARDEPPKKPATDPGPKARGSEKVGVPMSGRDRVYTADQTSNTVSVIDPATNKLLGVLFLGAPSPTVLTPLYKGALLVHGLGYSPDHRTLAVVSIGSNSVTLIDTATNKVKGTVYVGRSPHEAFFTPDGKELWVAVRGEDYIAVLDPTALKEVRRIQTANGPGMVLFRPDGRYAFVPSSFTPELDVIETATYKVVARVKQASPFSPNLAISPDGAEVWFTLKDTGKSQVISAEPPFQTLATLDTGPITNHVVLLDNAKGRFAYVTVGSLNEVKVFQRNGAEPKLVTTIPVGEAPHGIWPSGDGSRVYIGMENGDKVQAIDTETNKVVATISVGQAPQALVYVSNAVPKGTGEEGLKQLAEATAPLVVTLDPSDKTKAKGAVVIRTIGLVDQLQLTLSGLKPDQEYDLILSEQVAPPYGNVHTLTSVKTDPDGKATGQALGPIRKIVTGSTDALKQNAGERRHLILVLRGTPKAPPVLVEKRQ